MSNQNRKQRARRRQQRTGSKYTEALREQQQREAMPDRREQTSLLARLGRASQPGDGVDVRSLDPHDPSDVQALFARRRERCNECGGDIRWVSVASLREHHPEQVDEVMALDPEFPAGDAWVCLECDNFGIMSLPQFEGVAPEADIGNEPTSDDDLLALLNSCQFCSSPLEWLDPASVAYSHRDAYLRAKEEFGAAILLDQGSASVCTGCGHLDFHPHGPF